MIVGMLVAALGASTYPAVLAQQVFSAPQGNVENVRFEQVAGGSIAITYDLVSTDPTAVFQIMLEVSPDGGKTFNVKPVSVSGDIGSNIRPGRGKKILWEAGKDVETIAIDQFRFVVRAIAGRGNPVSGTLGQLQITTTPPGARVSIDGVDRGVTPLMLTDLSAGSHQVLVRREGYLDNQQTITVRAGQNDPVSIAMTASTPPPSASQPSAPAPSGGGINPLVWVALGGGAAAAAALAGGGGNDDGNGNDNGPPPTQTCTFIVQPTSLNFPRTGGSQTVDVTVTPAGCSNPAWTASNGGLSWLSVSPTSGSGNGTVTLTAQVNAGIERSGAATIAGRSVGVVQQLAFGCTYNATWGSDGDPVGSARTTVPGDCQGAGCGERNLQVTANDSGCLANVPPSNLPSWFALFDPGTVSGTTRVLRFRVVERNSTGAARQADFSVAGRTITVVQCAGRCP